MNPRIRGNPLALLLVIFLMTACATTRTQTTQTCAQDESATTARKTEGERIESLADLIRTQTQDQTAQTQTLLLTTEGIPAERSEMTIPIQSLLSLPEGAKYTTQTGRASVEAQRRGENLIITAKMDSIARRCLYYENQAFRQRQTSDSLRTLLSLSQASSSQLDSVTQARTATISSTDIRKKPPATWRWWLLIGFMAGGASVAWLTKTNPLKVVFSLIKKIV